MKSFDKSRKDYFEDETLNENDEEEDRVFLRPVAVNSPLNNLNKRTSLDFNQNSTASRNSKSRSMSLPVTYSDLDLDNIFSSDQDSSSSCFQNNSSSNSSLLSPLRKTDFAFCKWIFRLLSLFVNLSFSLPTMRRLFNQRFLANRNILLTIPQQSLLLSRNSSDFVISNHTT